MASSEVLDRARTLLRAEADALVAVAGRLDGGFAQVADLLHQCGGRVAVTGVGKSADVAQKLVGTLNSTGTRAYGLDAVRALHGDLGMVHPDDVVLLLSHSGESDELVRLLGPVRQLAAALVAITGSARSTLARQVDAAIIYGPLAESDPLCLAPSTSSLVLMALGQALAFELSGRRDFSRDDFARYHPAGSLGRGLSSVTALMRRGADLRLASECASVRAVFSEGRPRGRRTGAVLLLDAEGRLSGLFTDSDLARLFEARRDGALDRPIAEVMTRAPLTVPPSTRVSEALELFRATKVSELPVVGADGRPLGLLDITDLVGAEAQVAAEPALRVLPAA